MTPPAEFYSAVVASLDYLDTKLPAGSSVVIIGLVDGRIVRGVTVWLCVAVRPCEATCGCVCVCVCVCVCACVCVCVCVCVRVCVSCV